MKEKELTNRKKNCLIFGILGLSSVFTLDWISLQAVVVTFFTDTFSRGCCHFYSY